MPEPVRNSAKGRFIGREVDVDVAQSEEGVRQRIKPMKPTRPVHSDYEWKIR